MMTSLSEVDSMALCVGNTGPHLSKGNPIEARDKRHTFNTAEAQKRRATYLDPAFEPDKDADGWKHGHGKQLTMEACNTRLSDGRVIKRGESI
jgi:hypothetical protein